jgi:hypothetical protein
MQELDLDEEAKRARERERERGDESSAVLGEEAGVDEAVLK